MNALSTTLYELFADNLALRSDKIALVDTGASFSYGQVAEAVDGLAGHLQSRGVAPGDRVAIQLRKSFAEVVAMLAVAKIGGVVVNVNVQWTIDQLRYVLADSEARCAIVEPRTAPGLAEQAGGGGSIRIVVHGSVLPSEPFDAWQTALASPAGTTVPRLDTELAMIMYTSGSTGKPKGVMLSHRNLLAGARSVARYLELAEDDRLLSVLPYSFDYGLNQLTTMLLMGGTVIHQPVPMATEIVRTVEAQGATGLAAVPPLWNQIVRLLDGAPRPLPTLRRVTNSGGKIPLPILQRMPHVFPGVRIYLMYGLTEAFRSTYLPPAKFAAKMGSIGRAVPGAETYAIKHGVGVAGPGEQGELVHRGPLVSLGYWRRPTDTKERIRPCPELRDIIGEEPVVYSGDLVRVDEDGDYWFVGREDAMLKVLGFRLSPEEVEEQASRCGMVGDAVAFGVDDDEMGQAVHLAVTPLPHFDEAGFLKHCRAVMPHYMVPQRVHVWREPMPLTGSGKLARPEVVRRCREALQATNGQEDRPKSC